jgi:hypothetical protein
LVDGCIEEITPILPGRPELQLLKDQHRVINSDSYLALNFQAGCEPKGL